MTEFEKCQAKATHDGILQEMFEYASRDEFAKQVVRRTNSDPEFRNFMIQTLQLITIDKMLEDENDD